MVYLLHTHFQSNKKVKQSLSRLYGIGTTLSAQICSQLGISEEIVMKQLSTRQLQQISQLFMTNYTVTSELRQLVQKNIQRLIKIKSYRGYRHRKLSS